MMSSGYQGVEALVSRVYQKRMPVVGSGSGGTILLRSLATVR